MNKPNRYWKYSNTSPIWIWYSPSKNKLIESPPVKFEHHQAQEPSIFTVYFMEKAGWYFVGKL